MKTTILNCPTCFTDFTKATKEITRQRKKNANHPFFCSRSCHSKVNFSHILGKGHAPFTGPTAESIEATRIANTKYTLDERPFYEHLRRCEKRNKSCTLTVADLAFIWTKQRGKCAISNIPLLHLGEGSHIEQASVDRIDSSKGYTKDNVQFVSCSINWAKNKLPDHEVHRLMRLICENYLTRESTLG